MPAQGCILWLDNWVVPVGAPNPTAAYAFINYTYQPQHQAQISAWTASVTPVTGVKEVLQKSDPTLARSNLIFPSAQYTKNCSPVTSPPGSAADQQKVEQAWASAITG
jgi:spermidine/putrescine transport system substrate-binding protein